MPQEENREPGRNRWRRIGVLTGLVALGIAAMTVFALCACKSL
jgi:hypothetical protein